MTTAEEQLQCFYLDASSQNASAMLRKCVQDRNSELEFNCRDDPLRQDLPTDIKDTARMNDIAIQRGITENHLGGSGKMHTESLGSGEVIEGFTSKMFITDEGPGKTNIPKNQCPEGFSLDKNLGKCIQKCQSCVYRDNMKSQQFNEADPCFPEGTYDGVTNEGFIKCTCGSENQYCSDKFIQNIFTPDGMLVFGQKIIANVASPNAVDALFDLGQL
tara:strand:+ start:122 stop:772 length:651 start_codon:yes stop_codon:yes gene_type:complete